MKREPIIFFQLISGIFLLLFVNVYPKEDVEIVIQTGHNGSVNSVAISPNGRTIVSGSDDKTIRLWDKVTGKEIRRLQGHTYEVNSVAISPDGQTIVSGSYDGEIKICDSKKGNLIATLIAFNDGEWVAYTPDNYYICSPGGKKYVTFRVGEKIYEASKYSDFYKNEEAVAMALRLEDTTQKSSPTVIIRYFKRGNQIMEPYNNTVASSRINVVATAVERIYGIKKIVVQVNGRAVIDKNVLNKKRCEINEEIRLKSKNNRKKTLHIIPKMWKGIPGKLILPIERHY